jgi:hypothetical protein
MSHFRADGVSVAAVVAIVGLAVASCGSATLKAQDGGAGAGGGSSTATGGTGGERNDAAAGAGGHEHSDAAVDSTHARDGSADTLGGCPATCPAPRTGAGTGAGACVNGACGIACASAYPTLCSALNSCVDTTLDGKNCGACGHDCLGGACASGQCQPVLLAQYTGNLTTIFVGAQDVYATTDEGYIGRASKDGSDLKPFAMPGFVFSGFPGTSIVEDGDRAFFVWYGATIQLAYCSLSGCEATITPIGGPYTQFFNVDHLDHKVFWVDYSPAQLWSAPTTATTTGAALPGGTLPSSSNGSHLFYNQGGIFLSNGDVVERLSASGGSFANLVSSSTSLTILGANDNYMFLYDGTSVVYTTLPNGTGEPATPLISTPLNPNIDGHFAADDTSAYWVNQGVQTCEIANCAATVKALPSHSGDIVDDVGIDDQAVYWGAGTLDPADTSMDACAVWKLAK